MALWCSISVLPGLWYNGTPDCGYTEGGPTSVDRAVFGLCVLLSLDSNRSAPRV